MLKKTLITLSLLTGMLLPVSVAEAQTNCQPLYGGGETCIQAPNLSINKTIKNPQSGAFVDNLGINDTKYGPNQTVPFRIVVTNTTKSTITGITVRDIFPQYLDFSSGDGSFDKTNHVFTAKIDSLPSGQSKTIDLNTTIASINALPADQNVICVVNQAQATQGGSTGQDNAQFCIARTGATNTQAPQNQPGGTNQNQSGGTPANQNQTKGGLPIYQNPSAQNTPKTGPELLALVALLPSSVAGFILRRKAR